MAIATNRFGSVGVSIGALVKFFQEKKIVWKYMVQFCVIAVVGGYLGAHVAVKQGYLWVKRAFAVFVVISAVQLIFLS